MTDMPDVLANALNEKAAELNVLTRAKENAHTSSLGRWHRYAMTLASTAVLLLGLLSLLAVRDPGPSDIGYNKAMTSPST